MTEEKMILEIGCGEKRVYQNSICMDIRKNDVINVCGDAKYLPFFDNSFDHIYSSHIIEHFSHTELDDVIQEWIRVLKKGGVIEIRCPDLRLRSLLFFLNPSLSQHPH